MSVLKKQKQEKQKERQRLFKALKNGDVETVSLLIEENPKSHVLVKAIEGGNLKVVELLIKKGANFCFEWKCETALSCALDCENLDIFNLLVKNGCDPLSEENVTLLHKAIRQNRLDLAEYLISIGLDVNAESGGFAPLGSARTVETAKFLIEHGASLENSRVFSHNIIYRNFDMINYFLSMGVDPHKLMYERVTPFTMAVSQGLFEVAKSFNVSTCTKQESEWLWRGFKSPGNRDINPNEIFRFLIENNIKNYKPAQLDCFKEDFWDSYKVNLFFLFSAREKNPESPFYKDQFPLDIFKIIFKFMREILKEGAWEKLKLGKLI